MYSFVLLISALSYASASSVTTLTSESFDSTLESDSRPWLVEFFAPWCQHCQKLQPIWDELGKSSTNVNWAKVDCTTDKSVCTKFGVEGYPRILTFTDGAAKWKEYKGPRTYEVLSAYARRITSPPINILKTEKEVHAMLAASPVVFFFVENDADPNNNILKSVFTETAKELHDSIFFGHITASALKQLEQQQKQSPFPSKRASVTVVREREDTLFQGAQTKDEMIRWVLQHKYVLLPKFDGYNFKEIAKLHKYTCIAIVDPDSKSATSFLDTVRGIAKTSRIEMSFGWIDGPEWKKFLEEYDMSVEMLPRILVADSEMEYYLVAPSLHSQQGILSFLKDVEEGKLEMKHGWGVTFKKLWEDFWILIILGGLAVVIIPVILVCMIDDEPKKKRAD